MASPPSSPALSLASPSPLAPAAATPPPCFRCHRPSRQLVTRSSNRKHNGGRPYHKCVPCNKFLGFADDRGNDPRNPACPCGHSSRTQRAGSGQLHYVCRMNACDFYQPFRDASGAQVSVVGEDLVEQMAGLRIL
ncbi:hypothetical protein PG990_004593 [Apiospora arundinis]|uniref:GRF-like zinc ribbon domain-containing protein n=1 Tax=Apiospora arundinis TaxID=335852 RepID=A0ABR2J542_9PEZI